MGTENTKHTELFHDSDYYEIFEYLKAVHRQFTRLNQSNSDNAKIIRLADKFYDDVMAIIYPDDADKDYCDPENIYGLDSIAESIADDNPTARGIPVYHLPKARGDAA